jgi:TatA/E family protein of Tat protein translocase
LALDPIELLIVGAVVVVIFLWGPGKIPEMARSLGRAKKEFDSAQKEFQDVTKQFQAETGLTGIAAAAAKGTNSGSILDRLTALAGEPALAASTTDPQLPQPTEVAPPPAAAASDSKSADQVLIETARQLGIATEGKTREEISQEILAKAKAGSSGSSYSAPT